MLSDRSYQVPIMRCVVNILQKMSTRGTVGTTGLCSGKSLEHYVRVALIQLSRLYNKTLPKSRNIYNLLATRTSLLLDFHALDLAMIHRISWSQLTHSGVIYRSFYLFIYLMAYTSGLLRQYTRANEYL
jgi:hypothetical protein